MKIIYLIIFITFPHVGFSDIVFVIAKNTEQYSASSNEIKKLFTGRSRFLDGKTFRPILQSNNDIHRAFLETYIKRSTSQFKSSWKKLIFTGKAKAPINAKNDQEVIKEILGNKNSIGYIHSKNITPNLSIVTID